ncbi:hypothetical protein [Methylobacter sp. BBA5.1]|jgi:hypothetical protein|uniref:hypothetical protein n=1 Tax=Methylobacter sp. BBA5.1 TaxID=1495064 RepID=UPI00068CA825|nr:hypothetical protein [Methylobacter sp. BBA5.1]
MSEEKVPYSKCLDDELDWKLIDQLHSAVSQISGFCFEAKKLCVTVQFVVIGVIATFTEKKLDHAIFVAGFLIPLCFWFLDSVGYYYQAKLRTSMEKIRGQIASRNNRKTVIATGVPFISKERSELSQVKKIRAASLNHSMWLYGLMILIDLGIWWLYCIEVIS